MKTRLALPTACMALLLLGSACQEHDFKTCDITQRACQEDIYYRMLSLRGDGYDPFGGLPPVGVISEDDFRAMLMQEQTSQGSSSSASPWNKGLALLHFTSNGGAGSDAGAGGDAGSTSSTLDDQVAHTYAFYSPTTRTITIIKHPTQADDTYAAENAMVTLAHELVHAIQDRELDLKKEDFTTTDEYFAYDAIIEGDARLYEYLFVNEIRGLLKHPALDVVGMPTDELDQIYGSFAEQATPMFLAQLLVYPLGAKYEALEYKSGGNAAVRHGYSKEPHHMVGFLVGDDGRVPAVGSGDVCPGLYASSLPTDGKTVGADQFGALLFYSFLRGWKVDHQTAFAAAQAWTGDYLLVQSSADFSTSAASWRIEFSITPPASITRALSETGELSVTTGTQSLQITATDARTPLAWKPLANCP
jgi:hypothetical protein